MREKALHWLYRELNTARNALGRSPYPSAESVMWQEKCKVLEYLAELVTKEEAEDD
jgi:hypothetical protein